MSPLYWQLTAIILSIATLIILIVRSKWFCTFWTNMRIQSLQREQERRGVLNAQQMGELFMYEHAQKWAGKKEAEKPRFSETFKELLERAWSIRC